jgi:hypothetical protein
MSLRGRFEAFIRTLDGFEDIDELLKGNDPPNMKRADYLLSERKIIIEQKSLEVDPTGKPQRFVDKLVQQQRLLFWGRLSTRVLFSKHPDAERLQRQLVLKIAEVIDDNVATADKQTRDTRTIFSIPEAAGLLVLLNEQAGMLSPDIVHYALAQAFQKKAPDGALRYPHNDGVMLIAEAHPVAVSGFAKAFPIMCFIAPDAPGRRQLGGVMDMLQIRWAQFNGVPLIKMTS